MLRTSESVELVEMIDRLFNAEADFQTDRPPVDVKKSLDRVLKRINEPELTKAVPKKTFRNLYINLSVAASLILLIFMGWRFLYSRSVRPDKELNTVSTVNGTKSSITLPDGTVVRINKNTKLTYPKTYGTDLREVSLDGEAFFDVKRDEEHPFVVHTNNFDVRVLGTAFNVRAYAKDARTETTLIRGAVQVLLKGRNNKIINLRPNEKLVLNNESNTVQGNKAIGKEEPFISVVKTPFIMKDSTTMETLWANNEIVFNQETFAEIIPKLERWYGVHFEVEDPSVLKTQFSGRINRSA
ncbi:MAG: FecR family protein [Niabella sp.]|nr:FecR family protein [Niabella sp.]